jgi:hypothetical protein
LLPAPNGSHTDGPFATLAKAQSAMQSGSVKLTEIETGTYTMSANWDFTSADANEKWLPYSGQNTVTLAFGGTY